MQYPALLLNDHDARNERRQLVAETWREGGESQCLAAEARANRGQVEVKEVIDSQGGLPNRADTFHRRQRTFTLPHTTGAVSSAETRLHTHHAGEVEPAVREIAGRRPQCHHQDRHGTPALKQPSTPRPSGACATCIRPRACFGRLNG